MGIVRFALRFPHTFYVLAALIVFLGGLAIKTMPADIFPEINIPVVTVIWQYTGLSTPEMEQRVTTYSQYAISSNVNGIKNMEAQTLDGISVQKIFFQPDVNVDLAISQIISATNFIRVVMPPGIQSPVVVQFNASSVPVLQLSLSSDSMSEQQLYDYGIYRVRQGLAPVPGVTLLTPSGGKYRQIMVDIDPNKLSARGLTPLDVVNAVNAQNLTVPSGTAKMGDRQYVVRTNATPPNIAGLNDIPIKSVNGAMVFVRDIGQVHDGWLVQQNIVREDGKRSVLLSIIKNGNASTLAVVNGVREALKTLRAAAPPGLKIGELLDQSVFVREAVQGVAREGLIAAGLTALMILLFLGSWRSTLVVMISIPLSILASLVCLKAMGHTLNTMTLGGLALAVGILVDDSTVTIENTHRLLTEERQPLPLATLHGAAGIAIPTLVSTIAICCVFTSVVFLDGPAKYLFTPLGLAVVFAMLASYILSRTLTPITIGMLLRYEKHEAGPPRGFFGRFSHAFETGFENLRVSYVELLQSVLAHRFVIPVVCVAILALAGVMYVSVGRDFFPNIDSGQIQLHVRGPAGLRIEATEALFQQVEDKIREIVPEDERERIVDNIGLPARTYNLAFADGSVIGVNDGVIIVALKDGHAPTASYVDKLRLALRKDFPQATFYFQAADMVTQILNFGLPAQIDIRAVGYDRANNLQVAREIQQRIAAEPGFADAHLQQEVDAPSFYASIDRFRAQQFGLSASSIANNLNVALSSSEQVSPNFWTDPASGIPYFFAVQTPERNLSSINDLRNIPVSTSLAAVNGAPIPGLLSNVATLKRDSLPTNANQSNIQPVYEVFASLQGIDLGAASRVIDRVIADLSPQLKPGNRIEVVGQIQSMRDSFRNLGLGLLFAAVLVYFLMVVNYQNFGDPLVVILALPATFCGILTMLFITNTSLSVPSLMGAIMAIGVASANSILLVTFARERQLEGADVVRSGGRSRPYPYPAGADDGGGDDRRHGSHGDRRRRRGAERGAGAGGDRRTAVRDADHAFDRALSFRRLASRQ